MKSLAIATLACTALAAAGGRLRMRELAHVVGMAILVGLTLLAFKNDLEKRWDANAQAAKVSRG